jgi:tRNA dimethylallyltransferase
VDPAVAPLRVIAGPTASGKTALAVRVAQALGAEIVSADSQQVYRHFDVGTAKPSEAELAAVPHHLVSFVDPQDVYSAARFQADADRAIADIRGRGKPVVVVGGTGLYLRVLLRGVMEAPSANPAFRAELEARAAREGREALHRELAQVDPVAAASIQPTDLIRITRALEIHAATGRPASALRTEHAFAEARHVHRLFVLQPDRAALYEAINARTRAIYAAGLVEETRQLVARGYRDAAPMRSVGYAEALQVVDGTLSLERAVELTAQSTRKYAKRQFTWFKKEPGAHVLAPPRDGEIPPALLGV